MDSNEHSVDPVIEMETDSTEIQAVLESKTPIENEALMETSNSNGDITDLKPHTSKTIVKFKVVCNKKTYDVSLPIDDSVLSLKQVIKELTDIPIANQKIMFKGKLNEELTLGQNKVVDGSKMMVIGSTLNAVESVSKPPTVKKEESPTLFEKKEPLCKRNPHKNILDKYGMPDDLMPGIIGLDESVLPPVPIFGMYNKSGGKVRLTFKLELDQLWISTKERTEKLSLTSIKKVYHEAIEGHEEYHILALQLGPTEASTYWVYWVPSQYTKAINDAIIGP